MIKKKFQRLSGIIGYAGDPSMNISLTICISFKFINKEDELNYFIDVNPPVSRKINFDNPWWSLD